MAPARPRRCSGTEQSERWTHFNTAGSSMTWNSAIQHHQPARSTLPHQSRARGTKPAAMATSNFVTNQYASDAFVESCGAIVFDLSRDPVHVCLLHHLASDEWYLAKGRRNCGESRQEAALREVLEETGFRCKLLPVDMTTRAPASDDDANAPDTAAARQGLTEPFMLTLRKIEGGARMKLIWWYVATLENEDVTSGGTGEVQFEARFFSCEEAVEMLTFETDREVIRKAIALVRQTGCPSTINKQLNE